MSNITVGIPYYNQPTTLKETLASIVTQVCKPQEVIIVDDGSDSKCTDVVETFKDLLNIRVIYLEENMGLGYGRQLLLDECKTTYITFIDSDDIFMDVFYLASFEKIITNRNYDVIRFNFVEEGPGGEYWQSNSDVWLHGKIYNVRFLRINNIRFRSLRTHEDCYFNNIVLNVTSRILAYHNPVYFWRFNRESLTRKEDYLFLNYADYIESILLSYREIKRLRNPSATIFLLKCCVIAHSYIEAFKYFRKEPIRIIQNCLELQKLLKEDGIYQIFSGSINNVIYDLGLEQAQESCPYGKFKLSEDLISYIKNFLRWEK